MRPGCCDRARGRSGGALLLPVLRGRGPAAVRRAGRGILLRRVPAHVRAALPRARRVGLTRSRRFRRSSPRARVGSYALCVPTCSRCGEDNPDRGRFCLACGTPLTAAPAREVRKTVTVIFADVVGSTNLSERLDPEALRQVMTRYYDRASAVLTRHGGRVQKFIGDAVMAVFGVPAVREDDAVRAVRAAAELHAGLSELNAELERGWGVRLNLRTGVNTGEVVIGET